MDKAKLKKINIIFIYVSLVFLLVALYKGDYLYLPKIYSWFLLILSVVSVYLGMLGNALAWYKILNINNYRSGYKPCIISMGVSIFGKYIPGKFWMILGRSSFISEKYGYPIGKISSISLIAQLISIWVGLAIGLIGLGPIIKLPAWVYILSAIFLTLVFLAATPYFQKMFRKFIPGKIKKKISFGNLSVKQFFVLMPWFTVSWFFYFFGFYFFSQSITSGSINIIAAFTFPLAASVGIIAIISPGGLGIREGALVAFLLLVGVNDKDATTVSVMSRLWFFSGEALFFLTGMTIKAKKIE